MNPSLFDDDATADMSETQHTHLNAQYTVFR
jgi:hypothetical protein